MIDSPILLIADDDPHDVFFFRSALAQLCPELKVCDVADGHEAIEYLSGTGKYADRKRFPLPTHVFLDLKMPRRSGLEVLQWIRSTRILDQLPVTVLSGSQLSDDMERARCLGAEYLVKPVEYGALMEMISALCRKFGFLP